MTIVALSSHITLWRWHTVPDAEAGAKKPIHLHDG